MTYKEELVRKLVHLSSTAVPLTYCYASREFMLAALSILTTIALGAELLRARHSGCRAFIDRWLGKIIRGRETSTMTGATYVMLGCLLSVVLFPRKVAIAALLFLSISDALASLIGIKFGRARLFGKSLAGSTAFLVSAVAIVHFVQPAPPWIGIAGALTATVVEALPLKLAGRMLDDNLTIPLSAGTVMCGLMRWLVG